MAKQKTFNLETKVRFFPGPPLLQHGILCGNHQKTYSYYVQIVTLSLLIFAEEKDQAKNPRRSSPKAGGKGLKILTV